MQKPETNAPGLHRKFFWEFRFDEIDWEEAYKMVIGRIVERGGQDEIDEIVRYYGREKVVKVIRDELYFLSNYVIDRA